VLIIHTQHPDRRSFIDISQRLEVHFFDRPVFPGYWRAMRINSGKTENFINLVFHFIRHDMLELLCFFMNRIPWEVEDLDEKHLPQPMLPDDLERGSLTFFGYLD